MYTSIKGRLPGKSISILFRLVMLGLTKELYDDSTIYPYFPMKMNFTCSLKEYLSRITKTCLFKYTENFTTKKWKFSDKNSNSFHISAQNIDCGYSLEPPRWGGSNEYPQSKFLSRNKKNNVYPCKPQFYYIKVGFKGVKII